MPFYELRNYSQVFSDHTLALYHDKLFTGPEFSLLCQEAAAATTDRRNPKTVMDAAWLTQIFEYLVNHQGFKPIQTDVHWVVCAENHLDDPKLETTGWNETTKELGAYLFESGAFDFIRTWRKLSNRIMARFKTLYDQFRAQGFFLEIDDEIFSRITRRMALQEMDGKPSYCVCFVPTANPEDQINLDHICPCKGLETALSNVGRCTCGLFKLRTLEGVQHVATGGPVTGSAPSGKLPSAEILEPAEDPNFPRFMKKEDQ